MSHVTVGAAEGVRSVVALETAHVVRTGVHSTYLTAGDVTDAGR